MSSIGEDTSEGFLAHQSRHMPSFQQRSQIRIRRTPYEISSNRILHQHRHDVRLQSKHILIPRGWLFISPSIGLIWPSRRKRILLLHIALSALQGWKQSISPISIIMIRTLFRDRKICQSYVLRIISEERLFWCFM